MHFSSLQDFPTCLHFPFVGQLGIVDSMAWRSLPPYDQHIDG